MIKPEEVKKPNYKPLIIVSCVFTLLLIIGITIAIVLLTRKLSPIITPTVTPTNSHNYPTFISSIQIATSNEIPLQINGVTALSCVLYIDDDIKTAGMVVSANNVIDDFITIDLISFNLTYVRDFRTSQSYNNYNLRSGATYVVDSKQIEIFQLKLSDATVNNITLLTDIPQDKLNATFYNVSDIQTNAIIVASFVPASDLQTLDLIAFQQNGTLIKNLTTNIPIGSNYLKMLGSSQQDFTSFAVLDQTQSLLYDVFYKDDKTDTKEIKLLKSPICANWIQDTSVLIVCSSDSIYLYQRDISQARPIYKMNDFITFSNITIRNCAIDNLGQYFAICTTSKSIFLGRIFEQTIVSLKKIDTSILNINNSNGPIGIQKMGAILYIYQCDTAQDSVLIQVSAF